MNTECQHTHFDGFVSIGRLHDEGQPLNITDFVADISVVCRDCGRRFKFKGINKIGVSREFPTTNLMGTELRIPIEPADEFVDHVPKQIFNN